MKHFEKEPTYGEVIHYLLEGPVSETRVAEIFAELDKYTADNPLVKDTGSIQGVLEIGRISIAKDVADMRQVSLADRIALMRAVLSAPLNVPVQHLN